MGTTRLGCCGSGGRGFDTRGCFLLRLSEARLGADVDLSSGFSGLAVSVVAVTIGFSGAYVTF